MSAAGLAFGRGNQLVTKRGYRLVNRLPEPRMAEPDNHIDNSGEKSANQAAGAHGELPHVASPSISPADNDTKPIDQPAAETPVHALTIFKAAADATPNRKPRFSFPDFTVTIPEIKISRRMKRRGLMAATIALAAAFGATAGALSNRSLSGPEAPPVDTAAAEESQAMRKSIAYLTKEITTLKAGIESANKTATSQIGKIAARVDKLDTSEITGSISKPQTIAAVETPLPPTKPLMPPSVAPPQVTQDILRGWSVRSARDGIVLVEGHGEIYQVTRGVPLPGLGPVESIKRENGRWVVTTPKGIIVSDNTPQQRMRPYYPPYFRPY
jgi:hypothetical protein